MGLLKPDLYRSFAYGFALGVVVVCTSLGIPFIQDLADQVVPSAVAAPIK